MKKALLYSFLAVSIGAMLFASLAFAGPFGHFHFFHRHSAECPSCGESSPEARPLITFSTDKTEIKPGESATLSWSVANARSVTLDGSAVEASGSLLATPTATTTYTLAARGRIRASSQTVTIAVADADKPPQPSPTPTPVDGFTLSAIGFGSAFAVDDNLSEASRDHEIGSFLSSQNGTWTIISDEVMADKNHPAVFDDWAKALGSHAKPAVIWHDQGKILAIDEVSGKTKADILALAKSHVPTTNEAITLHGKKILLGLKPRPKGTKSAFPSVRKLLKPLAAADCPSIDLSTQCLFTKNQTGGTCVLNATAGACEAAVYAAYGKANCHELSPYFLANLTNGYNGTYAEAAIQEVLQKGNLLFGDMEPYDKLPAGWQKKAADYKALAVYGPPDADSPGYLRAALHRGYIALCGISVGSGFEPNANGYISYARGAGTDINHEIKVVGWNQENNLYLIHNSWGKDWGVNGYAWLDAKFFEADNDLWVVVAMSAAPSYKFYPPEDKPARLIVPEVAPRATNCCPGGNCPYQNAN